MIFRSRISLLTSLSVCFLFVIFGLTNVKASDPCTPFDIKRVIECENSKPGTSPSEWDIRNEFNQNIQGFADGFSFNKGQTINFKISTNASSYKLDIYRIGFYGGLGARKITTIYPSVSLPQIQPNCLTDQNTRLLDCGNWQNSVTWNIPSDTVSGFFIGKLERTDGTPGKNYIYFVIRDDQRQSDLLFQLPDTTWQAYNTYGGVSLYEFFAPETVFSNPGQVYKVSYNRPFNNAPNGGNAEFIKLHTPFRTEYPFIRWLESNGYDVGYFSGIDTEKSGGQLLNHKLFISEGHDEYWSSGQRSNVENARNQGVNLAFFSGNEMFWKTRWENSISNGAEPYRTLVTYKETNAGSKTDPSSTWTGTWRDPRFSPPSDGGKPENALTGTIFTVNGSTFNTLNIPYEYTKMRLWRNTSIANAAPNQTISLPEGILGFEWDEDLDNGARPAGLVRYSRSTHNVTALLKDYGSQYSPGIATHSATLYKHSSGALVFGAGTIEWSWGLDDNHDMRSWEPIIAPDSRIRQATVNLFADMGIQPSNLNSSLIPSSKSTDYQAPSSQITSLTPGQILTTNSPIVISGNATDQGGVVGGVEISTDNGNTWHPTEGLSTWSYLWHPPLGQVVTIKSRAVDDSGNIENPSAGITVSIVGNTSVKGKVFLDSNNNYVYDQGELGLPNKTVTLYGVTNQSTKTDGLGNYTFTNLPAANHRVKIDPPSIGLVYGSDNDTPASTTTSQNKVVDFALLQHQPIQMSTLGNSSSYCSQGIVYNHFEWSPLSIHPWDYYQILSRAENESNFSVKAVTSGTAINFNNTIPGLKYFYKVKTFFANGTESLYSDADFYLNSASCL